jgi:phosphotransferase system HPr (HPr) family protein
VRRSAEAAVALHARPASLLAAAAAGFASEIRLHREGRSAEARSVLALMSLDVEAGDALEIEAEGEDAEQAVEKIESMLRGDGDG